jgi:NTE family protein
MPDARDKEQRVRERAYRIWEEERRPNGKEKEHWERARKQIEEENAITGCDQDLDGARVRGSPARPNGEAEMNSSIAIVFSGGVGLGAYQAGAYARLHEEPEIAPGWYAGSSTGAVNAAIILGSPPDRRVEHLRKFWSTTVPQVPFWSWPHSRHWLSAIHARLFGVYGQFHPRVPAGLGRFSSLYDLSPMRERLQQLIDFDRLNAASERFSIATTDLETGRTVIFESTRESIRMEHLLASCGFIPEFAPVEIDGKLLGDGGLSANTPVEAVLLDAVETVFVLDCFARDGIYSPDLETALARKNDLIYGNQTLRALELLMDDRQKAGRSSKQNIIYLSYRPRPGEAGSERVYDFSSDTIDARWQSGTSDMSQAVAYFRDLGASPQHMGLHLIR